MLMVSHNHIAKIGKHQHHDCEENIMMVLIIPYIASPLPAIRYEINKI